MNMSRDSTSLKKSAATA